MPVRGMRDYALAAQSSGLGAGDKEPWKVVAIAWKDFLALSYIRLLYKTPGLSFTSSYLQMLRGSG